MYTPHHGYWTIFAARKQKYVGWFVFSSVMPDIVYYVMFLYLVITRNAFQVLDDSDPMRTLFGQVHDLFEHPAVFVLRQAGHSM